MNNFSIFFRYPLHNRIFPHHTVHYLPHPSFSSLTPSIVIFSICITFYTHSPSIYHSPTPYRHPIPSDSPLHSFSPDNKLLLSYQCPAKPILGSINMSWTSYSGRQRGPSLLIYGRAIFVVLFLAYLLFLDNTVSNSFSVYSLTLVTVYTWLSIYYLAAYSALLIVNCCVKFILCYTILLCSPTKHLLNFVSLFFNYINSFRCIQFFSGVNR